MIKFYLYSMIALSTKSLPNDVLCKFPEIECIDFIETETIIEKFEPNTLDETIAHNYIVTSKNALPFIENAKYKGNFFVVGNSTQIALESKGKSVILHANYGHELYEKLKDNPEKFYFLSGNKVAFPFHEKLPNCERIEVYKTRLTPKKVEKTYDVLFFFSPSAVISYTSVQNIPSKTTIFALGNTTAQAILNLGTYNVHIPKKPTLHSLLETYETWKKA